MSLHYFFKVPKFPSSFKGIEIIGSENADTWFASNYYLVSTSNFASIKSDMIELANKLKGRETNVYEWDWHHIVEGQHAAMLSVRGDMINQYNHSIPVILIHKPEHQFFSRNFNNKEFFELIGAYKMDKMALQAEAMKLKRTEAGIQKLKARVKNLKEMYSNMYENYPTLKKVAWNIFDTYEKQF